MMKLKILQQTSCKKYFEIEPGHAILPTIEQQLQNGTNLR